MKTEKNILVAFILNLSFSIFELVGGIITGSVAILSDSVHDIGDAVSIGASLFFERKSKKQPDEVYTYGYARYSVLGGVFTTVILLVGSILVILNAFNRIINPVEINYNGMIIFAVIGVIVNFVAAYFTKEGDSLNQKAVNLHMLEDVLGWVTVLVGAVIMRFTDIAVIDPIMSIGVAVFILYNSVKNLKEAIDLFLEKKPNNISVDDIKNIIKGVDGVDDVHHIHIWSMDGISNYATMHIITNSDTSKVKSDIRHMLSHSHIEHVTIETEAPDEVCENKECHTKENNHSHHHHHHHHH